MLSTFSLPTLTKPKLMKGSKTILMNMGKFDTQPKEGMRTMECQWCSYHRIQFLRNLDKSLNLPSQKLPPVSLTIQLLLHYTLHIILPLHFIITSKVWMWLKYSYPPCCLSKITHKYSNLISLIYLNVFEDNLTRHYFNRWTCWKLFDLSHCAVQRFNALIHKINND